MGRTAAERHIHFNYTKEFIEVWKAQNQTMKDLCEEVGKPYGYTGQNVFYCLLHRYLVQKYSGNPTKFWQTRIV